MKAALEFPCAAFYPTCRAAAQREIAPLIRAGTTARALDARGYADDVELALAENVSATVPRLIDGAYRAS